jgi:hypothetical protein
MATVFPSILFINSPSCASMIDNLSFSNCMYGEK